MPPIELEHWTLQAVAGPIPERVRGVSLPVRVPCTAMTALLEAGLVPDPLLGEHEARVQWVGEVTWRFATRFATPAGLTQPQLVLDGVDTVATVTLNGVELGRTETMHRPYRLDVAPGVLAAPGRDNELVVELAPAVAWAEAQRARLGALPFIEWPGAGHPYNFVRKMACNFGWDWGPTVVTAGLWRAVRLEDAPAFAAVRPLVYEHGDDGAVRLCVHLDPGTRPRRGAWRLDATLRAPSGRTFAQRLALQPGDEAVLELVVDDPERWWPVGYGAPALHTLELRAVQISDGAEVFAWSASVGLRTVALDTSPDEAGSRFLLRVNGAPVFCKGANWIPDDPFLERIDRDRLRARLEQALGAHHNMLRVWGGGIFESDDFYGLCDELGLLVWQDFLFACAMYPEEEPFASLVESEARHHVARLSRHASLVVWCGCNENLWAYEDWGWPPWKDQVAGRTWGRGFYLERLPRVVAELDPTRPYWPGSPYSADGVHPLDDGHGTKHVWDAWNETDYTIERSYRPRFVAEFGHQAPATLATLREALPGEALAADAPALRHRQKAIDGHAKLEARLAEHFSPPPPDAPFERWLYLTQLNQARAVSLGVEWWRSLWPHCTGTLYWQLNDCWAAVSWAAIDYGGRKKPLWYALRRSFAPRLVSVQPALSPPAEPLPKHAARRGPWTAATGLDAVFVNDTDEAWSIAPLARRLGLDGAELAACALGAHQVAARSVLRLPLDETLAEPITATRELLEVRCAPDKICPPERALWFFARDKALELEPARLTVQAAPVPGGYALELEAHSLVRDLVVLADALAPDAEADTQLVTLLPGERARIVVTTAQALDAEALTRAPLLQCTTTPA